MEPTAESASAVGELTALGGPQNATPAGRRASSGLGPFRMKRRVAADRNQELDRRLKFVYGFIGIVVVLGIWQLMAGEHWINPLVSSSPIAVVKSGRELGSTGVLWTVIGQSAKLFGVSFGIALVAGVIGGMVIGWYRHLGALLDPLVSVGYAAPRIALIPMIVVWFGVGFEAQVVTVLLIAVFPILVNVQAGFSSVDRDLLKLARSFRATNFDVLKTIAIPAAMPYIISGVRQGLAQGLTGVVIAEYLIGSVGIGGLIVSSGQSLNSAAAYVGVFVVAIASLILTAVLRRIERHFDHWRRS